MAADQIVRVRRDGPLRWRWRKDMDGPHCVVVLDGLAFTRRGARRAGAKAAL